MVNYSWGKKNMKVNGVFSKISERNWKILLILMVCVFSVIVYISMSVVYWREVDESIVKSQLSTKDILVKLILRRSWF